VNIARDEGTADEGPVRVNKADRAPDEHTRHCLPHNVNLLEDAVNELGAVALPDKEALNTRAHDPSLDLEARAPSVTLSVDRPDAMAGYHEVVDVRPGPRNSPIMQYG
jgi:hypothetical protein